MALRIGVLGGGGSRDEVSRQLTPIGTVEWFERTDALVRCAVETALDAVVTGLRDQRGRSVAPMLVELAAVRPSLPVVLHARVDRAALVELLSVFALGLHMECVVRPFGRLEPVLRHMLSPAYRPGVAPLLLQHFLPRVPAAVSVFVALAILTASVRPSVEELAAWSGVSPRTIERRLRRADLASARSLARAFAALDAVWLMTEYGWSARRVQQVRGFAHASSVTRLLASYVGTRPSTLMEDGGFSAALEHVTRVLLAGDGEPTVIPQE
jgi:hypothetical protein